LDISLSTSLLSAHVRPTPPIPDVHITSIRQVLGVVVSAAPSGVAVTIDGVAYPPFIEDEIADGFHTLAPPSAAPATGDGSLPGDVLALISGLYVTPEADGVPAVALQWLRNGIPVTGETRTDYTLTDADVGMGCACRETVTTSAGSHEELAVFRETPALLKFRFDAAGSMRSNYFPPRSARAMTFASRFDFNTTATDPAPGEDNTKARIPVSAEDGFKIVIGGGFFRFRATVYDASAGGGVAFAWRDSTVHYTANGVTEVALLVSVDLDRSLAGGAGYMSMMIATNQAGAGWVVEPAARVQTAAPIAIAAEDRIDTPLGLLSLFESMQYNMTSPSSIPLGATVHQFAWFTDAALDPETHFSDFFDPSNGYAPRLTLGSDGRIGGMTPKLLLNGAESFLLDPPVNFGSADIPASSLVRFGTVTGAPL
jgi:hypothetical protein